MDTISMDTILIRELVDEICYYLEIPDLINFHFAYSYPLSSRWLKIIYDAHKKEIKDLTQFHKEEIDNYAESIQHYDIDNNNLKNSLEDIKEKFIKIGSDMIELKLERNHYKEKLNRVVNIAKSPKKKKKSTCESSSDSDCKPCNVSNKKKKYTCCATSSESSGSSDSSDYD